MIKKCLIHKKIISLLLIFLISGFGVFGVARQVKAGSIGDMMLEGATSLMIFGIKFLGGALEIAVTLLTKILNWGNFVDAPIVKIGWTITRDLANMFFVLVLLIIAFGLILRQETYGSKVLLRNLIIAALLINFSLVIAGVVIDSSQVLTDFFITQSGGEKLLQGNLMNATQAVNALQTRDDVKVSIGTGAEAALNVFIGALLSVVFMVVIFLVFAAYAFLLIVRIVALWVLLIFAPLVWLLWAVPSPKIRQYWGMWWGNFLKWCFFAPISAFFIYLAIFSYKSLLTNNIVTALESSNAALFLPKITSLPNLVAFCIIIALLVYGIVVAQKAGIWGANGVMAFAKGGKNKVVGWSKRRAKELTARPTGRVTGAIAEQLAKRGIVGRQAARLPRAISEKTKAADRAAIERYEKKYKGYTEGNLKSQFKAVITDAHAKTAIAKILADRNKFEADKEEEGKKAIFTDKEVKQALDVAKKYNMHKDLLKSNLKMCSYVGEKPYDIIKSMKIKDMEKISLNGIIDSVTKEIVPDVKEALVKHLTEKGGALNKNFLAELSKNNFSVFKKIQNDIIRTEIMPKDKWEKVKEVRPDVTSYLNSDAGKALFHEVIGELDWIEEEKKKKKEEEKKKKPIRAEKESTAVH